MSRISRKLTRYGKPAAKDNLESMVIPAEFLAANPISQTDAEQKLTKLCSAAGFLKNVEKGQFFITLDDDALDDVKASCREYTLPRSEESSRVRG